LLKLLEELDLSYNPLGDEGVKKLLLSTLVSLKTLRLAQTDMGTEGVEALPLAKLTSLTVLDLRKNYVFFDDASESAISPEVATAIRRAFPRIQLEL
jgi:Ran GTPase-activating protein (RanGAP) involved in mRNA processing and transport